MDKNLRREIRKTGGKKYSFETGYKETDEDFGENWETIDWNEDYIIGALEGWEDENFYSWKENEISMTDDDIKEFAQNCFRWLWADSETNCREGYLDKGKQIFLDSCLEIYHKYMD